MKNQRVVRGKGKLGQVVGRQLFCLRLSGNCHRRGDQGDHPAHSKQPCSPQPLAAHSSGRAEQSINPFKQILNKQSGREAVCGFSVQMLLSRSVALRGAVCELCRVFPSDLSLQGEIRLSLSPSVNTLIHRWRMSIHPAGRQKICWREVVEGALNTYLYYLNYLRTLVE